MLDYTDRTVTAILGPTNTGKTHYALERMLARRSGIIGLPLRLLAREIYDRLVKVRGPNAVSLITGEEQIRPARATYHVATVEAMPLHEPVDFVAIDEIQLAADPDRGHVFTDRMLHARGHYETLFLGSDTARPRIADLVPEARFQSRERFSTLKWTGGRKISRLKPRTAVVAFSVDQVYAIAELIRRQRGGAAVVMGALSPRTRNAQVALYQEGEVDYMVATDAIGMGLNMDVDHVAFAGLAKFDGWRHRALEANELAQIAGRAGRYTQDGTFGVTGEAGQLDPETIDHIENHRFKPLTRMMWRNRDLDFFSTERLLASLDQTPDRQGLMRAREAEDQLALRTLSEDQEIRDLTNDPRHVKLLWDVCTIPDFRKVSPQEHAVLLGRIYRFLRERGQCIPRDWLAGQIDRLDRVDGDIDALSKRLAYIRTWTYVANRAAWIEDPDHWQGETRSIEDRLSDALHQRLTQRFVDRRTSVLMRRLKQKERLVAEIDDKGQVTAEGQYLGRLDGFRFTVDESATGDELKTLRTASTSALAAEFARRADKLYLSPDSEIDVTDQGGLMWGTDAIGKVAKGDDPLSPKIAVFVDDIAKTAVAEKVERRLTHWLLRRINALFEPLIAMRDDEAVTGLAKGVAYRLAENFGIMRRRDIAQDVKQLAQEDRALLRKHGVRFGQHFIFLPALLKPAPTRMRLLLWNLTTDQQDFAEAPPPGHVTVPVAEGMPGGYYEMAGYAPLNARALRIDMMERLADLLRPMDGRAGFEATQDMLSITGCTLEQFADMMGALGFKGEKGERQRTVRAADPESNEAGDDAAAGADPSPESPPGENPEDQGTTAPDGDTGVETATPETSTPETAASETAASESTASETAASKSAAPETTTFESAAPEVTTDEPAKDEPQNDETPAEPVETSADTAADTATNTAEVPPGTNPEGTVGSGDQEPTNDDASQSATPAADGTEQTALDASPTPPGDGSEIEVFYIFRTAPRGRRGPPRERGQEQGAGQGQARRDGQQRRHHGGKDGGKDGGRDGGKDGAKGGGERRGAKDGGKGGGKGGPKGKRKDRGRDDRGPRKISAGPPKKDRPVDPDNPFAVLQQLKRD